MHCRTEIEPKSNRANDFGYRPASNELGKSQPFAGCRHFGRLRGGVQCHKFRQGNFY